MEIHFSDSDLPTDAPTDVTVDVPASPTSDDLSCEVCGTPLHYKGRGRKPRWCDEHKRGSSSPRADARTTGAAKVRSKSSEVDAALARMDTLYSFASMAMMLASPRAAMDFSQRIEGAQQLNRTAFEADPRLTKRINATSQNAGVPIFVLANVVAFGAPLRVAIEDMRERAAERAADIVQEEAKVDNVFGFPPTS